MTDAALIEMVRRVPASKRQELYDFARFLVATYPAEADPVQPFETEDEMVAFMEDVGGPVYVG